MDNKDATIQDMNSGPAATQQFDTKGIPLDVGNRKTRRAMAASNRHEGLPENAHEQFQKEPIWRAMEKVMKHLKAWYALNGNWALTDPETMGVLNKMREDHEKREQEIRKRVAEAKQKEHERLEEVFARVEDKKILQNQLKSMKEEYATLTNIATIRTKAKQDHGKK